MRRDAPRRPSRRGHLPGFYKLSLSNKILVSTFALVALLGVTVAVTVQLGVAAARIEGFVGPLSFVLFAVIAGLSFAGVVGARSVFRYVTRPIVELTQLADQVSVGNLEVDFEFGVPVRCWDIKGCEETDCAAYRNTTVQCWFVDGTPCDGYEPRFPQKLIGCRTCEVYQRHKGDEIVQLYDSFRHMTHVLRISRSELEASDRFQRSLIHNSFDGIIATDETGVVRIFNRIAENLTAFTEEEVVGQRRWDELFDGEVTQELGQPLFQDGSRMIFGFYRLEKRLRCKGGGVVEVRASGITLRDGDRHVGKVFFFQDLREINRLRAELIQQERLAATGQTVASISHSVKNILEGLRGGAHIFNRGRRSDNEAVSQRGWEMVERNIDQISALVADLLNYARAREPVLELVDTSALVADIVTTLEPKAERQGVSLEAQGSDEVSHWMLDSHAMHQCLMNLVTNALDATATVDGGWVRVSVHATESDELELRVADNGPGVDASLLGDLFSSMVSTKGSRGTGLGLLVVHKIVTEHGGSVSVDPHLSPGATFRVVLPRRELAPTG